MPPLTSLALQSCSLLLVGQGRNKLIDTWDENLASGANELAEEMNEVGHWLVDCATEDTTVEISTGAGDDNLLVHQATETICYIGKCGQPWPV
jgi:hypothetical protein